MSRAWRWLALVAVLVIPAQAQMHQEQVGRVYVLRAKPGMEKQFEEGRKRHVEWHRKQNDTWTWSMYQIVTGEAAGSYVAITGGHTWQDFDAFDAKLAKADEADAAVNMDPYIASESNSFWIYLAEFSKPSPTHSPAKMNEVLHFMIKSGAEEQFITVLQKVSDGIKKTNWIPEQSAAWFALRNGGQSPHYVLSLPRKSWADMAGPEVSFDAMMEKAYGKEEAHAILESLGKSIEHEWSDVLVYRPDLSYVPAEK